MVGVVRLRLGGNSGGSWGCLEPFTGVFPSHTGHFNIDSRLCGRSLHRGRRKLVGEEVESVGSGLQRVGEPAARG